MEYLAHYGLARDPFGLEASPLDVYQSGVQHQVLVAIQAALAEGASLVTVGGAGGTGKTTVALQLLQSLSPDLYRSVFIDSRAVHSIDSVRAVVKATLGTDDLNELKQGLRTVIVVDNAHLAQPDVKAFLDEAVDAENITVIKTGTFESCDKLLEAWDDSAIARMLVHRMRSAGAQAALLEKEAILTIVKAAGGNPGMANLLAKQALMASWLAHNEQVSSDLVTTIVSGGFAWQSTASLGSETDHEQEPDIEPESEEGTLSLDPDATGIDEIENELSSFEETQHDDELESDPNEETMVLSDFEEESEDDLDSDLDALDSLDGLDDLVESQDDDQDDLGDLGDFGDLESLDSLGEEDPESHTDSESDEEFEGFLTEDDDALGALDQLEDDASLELDTDGDVDLEDSLGDLDDLMGEFEETEQGAAEDQSSSDSEETSLGEMSLDDELAEFESLSEDSDLELTNVELDDADVSEEDEEFDLSMLGDETDEGPETSDDDSAGLDDLDNLDSMLDDWDTGDDAQSDDSTGAPDENQSAAESDSDDGDLNAELDDLLAEFDDI